VVGFWITFGDSLDLGDSLHLNRGLHLHPPGYHSFSPMAFEASISMYAENLDHVTHEVEPVALVSHTCNTELTVG
jgi:hypothetical protein